MNPGARRGGVRGDQAATGVRGDQAATGVRGDQAASGVRGDQAASGVRSGHATGARVDHAAAGARGDRAGAEPSATPGTPTAPATPTAPGGSAAPAGSAPEPRSSGVIDHLLDITDLDAGTIATVLDTAEAFKELAARPIKKVPTLRGRTVCNLFFEDSTRTRVSFEIAAKRLSADVLNFSAKGSSVSKGESLKDTALTLQAMGVDAVVVRHHTSGAARQLTRWLDGKVLNAGDGRHQHPTQALLDLFTVREHFGRLDGLHVAVIGDVLHSRVARSLVQGLRTMGAGVTLVGPPTLLPMSAAGWDAEVTHDLDPVLGKADVVYLLRVQRERMREQFIPSIREYARLWGMDRRRLANLSAHAVVMHPGPMNRGVELTADVADAPNALITQQVANGVAVRMSCLYLMLGGEQAAAR